MQTNFSSSSIERRKESISYADVWDKLSMAQKFSASKLTQFGYQLICLRTIDNTNVAVLSCEGLTSLITEDGEINNAINIQVRH